MAEKLRICFLIAGFGEGGAQKQCIYLLHELKKRPDIEVHLIFFYEGVNFSFLDGEGITFWRLPARSFYDFRNILEIYRVVKRVRPNVIFSWLQSSDVYSYFVRLLCGKWLKWVLAERDSAYPSDWKFLLRRFLGRQADLVVANSKKGVSYWLGNGISPSRVFFVPNIVQTERPIVTGSTVKNKIVFAGRLEPQKNTLVLAAAFKKLAFEFPDVDFLIVGNGSLSEAVYSLVSGVTNIEVLPFQKNILEFFSGASVFVNVSLHEGMPNTVIENIALDTRVVVSRIDEHVALLGDSYPYYVRDLNCVEEVVEVVSNAYMDSKMGRLNEYGFARSVMSEMSGEIISDRYIDIFKIVTVE